jgi:hypothetical protein
MCPLAPRSTTSVSYMLMLINFCVPLPISILSLERFSKRRGPYTLCERCNNQTGSWHGPKYADWAYQGMQIVGATKGAPTLIYNFRIFPLRVIKQVV